MASVELIQSPSAPLKMPVEPNLWIKFASQNKLKKNEK